MPERNSSTDADHLSLNEDYSKLLSFPFVRTPVQQVLLSYPLHCKILRTNSKIYFGIVRVLFYIFEISYSKGNKIRNSTKVIAILGLAFLLMSVETFLKPYVAVSGLLAVVAMACVIKIKADKSVSARLSEKFGKLWIAAETVLFVLVGAAVDIRYTLTAGVAAVLLIFGALIFRAVGVWICLIGTKLTLKEKLFCVTAYMPKATVQAAIGSVPMSLGLPCGKIVLSVAVLAILITAPLGAIGIDRSYKRLLAHEE